MSVAIRQYPVQWGPSTQPWAGWSYFYTSTAVDITGQILPLFDAIKSFFPQNMTWTVPGWYREIDEVSGQLVDVIVSIQPTGITAPASAAAIAPSQGAQIRWNTSGFPHGRRVVGRTYLVPLLVSQYGVDGRLLSNTANTINAAADALRSRAGGEMKIWHRPKTHKDAAGNVVVDRPGSAWTVASTVCPTKPVQLATRRDV